MVHDKYVRPPLRSKTVAVVKSATVGDPALAAQFTQVEFPYEYDDGWCKVTVEWDDGALSKDKGAWVAACSVEPGCIGLGHTKEAALCDLIASVGSIAQLWSRDHSRSHKTLNASADVLAHEIDRAEQLLGDVQRSVTHDFPLPDEAEQSVAITDKALKPLWRAKQALRRLATYVAEREEREREMRSTLLNRCSEALQNLASEKNGDEHSALYRAAFFVRDFDSPPRAPAREPEAT